LSFAADKQGPAGVSRRVLATIHVAALRENLRRVRARAPRSKVMAVVKADGYGHGLERVAHALADADAFGVASIADGERIRAAGIAKRVVVLSGIDAAGDVADMRRLDLESVVHHESQLDWLAGAEPGNALRIWLKVDTGMHRLGFPPDRVEPVYARLKSLPSVDPRIALMTHFANSDVVADPVTQGQIAAFVPFARALDGELSLANSAGVLNFPQAHEDWIRVGGLLYGISAIDGRSGRDLGFEPAMTLSTRLLAINRVARGERVGYGGAWQCPEDMPVGVAAIGYGDGYPRHVAAGTPVLVAGRAVPIVGRVSMDLVTLDLRGHPGARVGDEVVVWGRGLPVEQVASAADTIGYELVCGMTRRVTFVEDARPL
jgi:alanine racemase